MRTRLSSVILVSLVAIKCSLDIVVELHNTGDTLALVASDQRLLRAACTEGLQVFNPEIVSQQTLVDWINFRNK